MKYLIFLFIFIVLMISGCEGETSSYEEPEYGCPNGLVNDPSPGVCKLYADEDNNTICDYSE
jgi:hypothetical protein